MRQSRKTTSVIVPRVHCAPVRRAPETATRCSDSSGAARVGEVPALDRDVGQPEPREAARR